MNTEIINTKRIVGKHHLHCVNHYKIQFVSIFRNTYKYGEWFLCILNLEFMKLQLLLCLYVSDLHNFFASFWLVSLINQSRFVFTFLLCQWWEYFRNTFAKFSHEWYHIQSHPFIDLTLYSNFRVTICIEDKKYC